MVRAIWNGAVIAESDDTVVIEGNHYFPGDSVRAEHLVASDHHTTCPWKGRASYHSIVVDGRTNRDAAWYYPTPRAGAEAVQDRMAFWRGVTVETDDALTRLPLRQRLRAWAGSDKGSDKGSETLAAEQHDPVIDATDTDAPSTGAAT